MTDQEKSVVLARLCGWEPLSDTIYGITGHGTVLWKDEDGYMLDPDLTLPLNLYDPANMALAAKVALWAFETILKDNSDEYRWVFAYKFFQNTRMALDKILELAIAAGMVTK